jgi:hypothetical protein
MPLTDAPIPPRPEFSPFGAPPGVAVDFTAFKAFNSSGQTISAPWWQTRLVIKPRLALVHTNGASKEGNLASQVNWANSSPNNTHPHFAVNAPQPTKFVPSDRKGIGNYRVSDWSIVIETADAGWPTPGNAGGFLYDHAEIVARILAYESIVADLLGSSMPLQYPGRWDGAGVGCHTEPFGYPYWTNSSGKACPGATKKAQVRDEILPRARQIRAAWLDQPSEDWIVKPYTKRVLDTRPTNTPLTRDTPRTFPVGMATQALVRIQALDAPRPGYLSIDGGVTSVVNYWPGQPVASDLAYVALDNGNLTLSAHGESGCHVVVDVQGIG